MPLTLGTANGYENVYWTYVLREIRAFLLDSSNYGNVYISPTIEKGLSQGIRLWGSSFETQNLWKDKWTKQYDVDINLYAISQTNSESFYKNFYEESERIYQLMYNNKVSTNSTLAWYNGEVSDIVFGELEDEEDEIDGLNKANFSFSCLIDRVTTATIIT
tara:strand:+ start:271 stop:753 length:483 start_codon:yes stop_codon:yes gene_type:complete